MAVASLEALHKSAGKMMVDFQSAACAFDAIAPSFDERFGAWFSVAAQRRAVRSALLQALPKDGNIFEIGGGTGEDAMFLVQQGFNVLMTDPSPAMVSQARMKLYPLGAKVEIAAAEDMGSFADKYLSAGGALFDGAFSNFAPLNCVVDLRLVAKGLAQLLKPGAPALLVLFGTLCPGEIATEVLCGRPRAALRRCKRGETPARLAGHEFHIVYHRRAALLRAFSPWFVLEKRLGIGIAVPPSAAEPWISHRPRLLAAMERFDRMASRSLAIFGDHILYQFRRSAAP